MATSSTIRLALPLGITAGAWLFPAAARSLRALPVPSPVSALGGGSVAGRTNQLQNQVTVPPAVQGTGPPGWAGQRLERDGGRRFPVGCWPMSMGSDPGSSLESELVKYRLPPSIQLGPDYRLSTRLSVRLPNGNLRLTGEGDPTWPSQLAAHRQAVRLGSGGGPARRGPVRLELPRNRPGWWPPGWHQGDRAFAYGAPINPVGGLPSNALRWRGNPPAGLHGLLAMSSPPRWPGPSWPVVRPKALPEDSQLLHVEHRRPMHNCSAGNS